MKTLRYVYKYVAISEVKYVCLSVCDTLLGFLPPTNKINWITKYKKKLKNVVKTVSRIYGSNYRVAMLSSSYQIVRRIIVKSLNSIGQFIHV